MENQIYTPEIKAILQEAFKGIGVLCTEKNSGKNGDLANFFNAIYNDLVKIDYNMTNWHYGLDKNGILDYWYLDSKNTFPKIQITLEQAIANRDAIVSEYYAKQSKTEVKKFKALMHEGEFVNYKLMEIGIRYSEVPLLFPENYNIETLVHETAFNLRFMSTESLSAFIENLEKCELVEVSLTIKTK